MAWDDAVVTNAGVQMLNRALGGEIIHLDWAEGGDGIAASASLMAAVGLTGKKQTFPVIQVAALAKGKRISIQITNKDLTKGYAMTEIGIFAHVGNEEPVLLAVLQDKVGVAIPAESEIAGFTMTFHAVVAVSGEAVFSITIQKEALQPKIMAAGMLKGDGMGGVEAAEPGEDYGYPTLKGVSAPTWETEGKQGQHYLATSTGKEYVCLGKEGEDYIWDIAGVTNTDDITYKGRPLTEALAAGLGSAAGMIMLGPASLIDRLPIGGLLLITDEANPEDYAVTLADLLAEGYKAANGQSDDLEAMLTVGRADVLDLRADITGTLFTEETLPTLVTAIRGVCAAAVANGAYVEDGVISLSWRQVEYYIIHGVLVSHAEACMETWVWAKDPSSEILALRRAVENVEATVGDMNAVLDEVLEGEDGNGEGQEE